MSSRFNPFGYPRRRHRRKHGPAGYQKYREYYQWLRDEFEFRCVYCLRREVLEGLHYTVDHVIPKTLRKDLECHYDNLVYACNHCNQIKAARIALDPCQFAYGACLQVLDSGEIKPSNRDGERLIAVLKLDSPLYTKWRARWISVVRRLPQQEITKLFCFPDDLPDLETLNKKVPRNSRPEGVKNCFFVRKSGGTLPPLC